MRFVKTYNDFKLDCKLELKPGTITALIGRNGSGKTTLFKLYLGLIEDVKAEFDSFIANHPLQSNKIRSGIVESLYEKIDVMKEAYRNYEEALKAFEDADMLNSENVKSLELASKNYTLARMDLENANNNLKVYLENVEDDVEIKEKESVNTATETALGLYSLSGILGLAGLALAGKKMKRKE